MEKDFFSAQLGISEPKNNTKVKNGEQSQIPIQRLLSDSKSHIKFMNQIPMIQEESDKAIRISTDSFYVSTIRIACRSYQ